MPVARLVAALAVVLAAALCTAGPAAAAPPAASPTAERAMFYVSLGDSYASGYQPTGPGAGRATRQGFAYQLVTQARRRGYRLRLVNFGCGGETTVSLLRRTAACPGPGPGGPDYAGRTQIAAAERFLRANRGRVGLITVSIGGNDVTACARALDPIACVATAVGNIKANVRTAVRRLRAAAGRKVRIVGITYPDVILGEWTSGLPAGQELARQSVLAFRSFINPALEEAYESVRGRLVDVTAATGAYGPLEQTTTLAPYGVLPVPVAEVCRLTFYCQYRDIHPRTEGYRVIADLIARTLPRRR